MMKILDNKFLKLGFVALAAMLSFTACDKDKVDRVLPDPAQNINAKITARADMSLLKAALTRSRLTDFTNGNGPFTLFAPSNAAFNAVGINTEADINALDSNLLVQILTYHIQSGARSYVEIPLGPNANMTTQGGLTQYASRKLSPLTPNAYINGVLISEPDVRASNGIIHVIERVLLPPRLTTAQTLASIPDFSRFYQAIVKTGTVTTTSGLTVFAVNNATMVAAGYDSTTIANLTPSAALTALTNIMKYHTVAKRIFSPDFLVGSLKTVQGGNVSIAGTLGSFTVKGVNNPTPFQIAPGVDIITTTGVVVPISGLLKP